MGIFGKLFNKKKLPTSLALLESLNSKKPEERIQAAKEITKKIQEKATLYYKIWQMHILGILLLEHVLAEREESVRRAFARPMDDIEPNTVSWLTAIAVRGGTAVQKLGIMWVFPVYSKRKGRLDDPTMVTGGHSPPWMDNNLTESMLRCNAIEALGEICLPTSNEVKTLFTMLTEDHHSNVREAAKEALKKIRAKKSKNDK